VVIHVALFRWRPECTEAEVKEIMGAIARLEGEIPEVVDLFAGEDFGKYGEGYTHAVVATFRDRSALAAYRDHPAHVPVARRVEAMFERSIGVDFEG